MCFAPIIYETHLPDFVVHFFCSSSSRTPLPPLFFQFPHLALLIPLHIQLVSQVSAQPFRMKVLRLEARIVASLLATVFLLLTVGCVQVCMAEEGFEKISDT